MEKFYSVEWNGSIFRWDLIKNSKDKGKWYRQTSLMKRNEADEWILSPNEPTFILGKINLSDRYISEKIDEGKFFPLLEDAYTKTIRQIEWLIKEGYFNKEYLA